MENTTMTVPSICKSPDKRSHHGGSNHLVVFENNIFSYVAVPPLPSSSLADPVKLCFTDHDSDKWDSESDQCCLHEAGHVHAHYHYGEKREDILLEQCMEEAGCALPMSWELPITLFTDGSYSQDHEHKDGCGHNQIAHGDHFDWLVPMNDGSFLLSHVQITDTGASQHIEHGRLVKVGESLGRLKSHTRQLFDLFGYESPKKKGYEVLPLMGEISKEDNMKCSRLAKDACCSLQPSPDSAKKTIQEDMVKVDIPSNYMEQSSRKTTLDVLGICCPAEVPLVRKILEPLPGVKEVSVNVASKIVTVLHDPALTPEGVLVKVLNEARMDASIRHHGELKTSHRWPSPYTMASGLLMAVAFFQYIFHPLKWVALAAVAAGLPPIVMRSLVSLRRMVLDINVLMLIAVGGSIGLGDYLEAGSIVFLFTLADWLESRSSDKARLAISAVMDLAPQNAVLANGLKVPVSEVKIGTKITVKAGESIPIDGLVISGRSSVDESSLTGESVPVEKAAGSIVWAGTMNLSGFLCVETTALAEDSAVARMVRLVEDAQAQRSPTEQLVERFAKYYTPFVVVTAIAIAVVPLALQVHNVRHWLYLALVLLVVACPCALVISTPVTTTCGIAQAARMGLIIKGGSFLEALGKLRVIAMDKTGTLTEGHFRVANVLALNDTTSVEQLLYWISCVENKASHPMASALVTYARLHGIEPSSDVEGFEIMPGEGVSGIVDGHQIHIGNRRLATRLGWIEALNVPAAEKWSSQGATVCWVGVDERPLGIFSVADQIRQEAVEAVHDLQKLGIRVAMLTGDSAMAANSIHQMIGQIEVFSQLLPKDKVEILEGLKERGMTGMVGDGINDAPALAAADVGMAMGVAGSAVAMETADIALMTNDLRKVAAAIRLGQKARLKIQQNVLLSFVTKALIIALAAAGYASLWAAVLADVGTCLLVVFNSMLLLKRKKGHSHCHDDKCKTYYFCHQNHHHRRRHHGHCQKRKKCSEGAYCCSKGTLVKPADASPCCKSGRDFNHNHHRHLHKLKEGRDCCTKSALVKPADTFRKEIHNELDSGHVCQCCDGGLTDSLVHSDDFGMFKTCCEVSGKSSSSGIRRRLGHKETCADDCQGVDCFALVSITEGIDLPPTSVNRGFDHDKHPSVMGHPGSHSIEVSSPVQHCCDLNHLNSLYRCEDRNRGQGKKVCQAQDGLRIPEGQGCVDSRCANRCFKHEEHCCLPGTPCSVSNVEDPEVTIITHRDAPQCCSRDCHDSFHEREPLMHHESSCMGHSGMTSDSECCVSGHMLHTEDIRTKKHGSKETCCMDCHDSFDEREPYVASRCHKSSCTGCSGLRKGIDSECYASGQRKHIEDTGLQKHGKKETCCKDCHGSLHEREQGLAIKFSSMCHSVSGIGSDNECCVSLCTSHGENIQPENHGEKETCCKDCQKGDYTAEEMKIFTPPLHGCATNAGTCCAECKNGFQK